MTDTNGVNTTRLGDADALMWAVEQDSTLASTMASIVTFDSNVDPEALRVRLDRATRIVTRMRQRVVGNPLSLSPPRWEIDPHFDLDRHFDVVDCPGEATMRDALDVAGPFICEPFDRSHPLFRARLVQGVDGDCSALIMKAHHAIADGLGMLQIQVELFDFEPDTADPTDLPAEPEPHPLTPGQRLENAVAFERARAGDALRDLASAVVRTALKSPNLVDDTIDTLGSALRAMRPVKPLSPTLTGRSSATWHDTATVPLADLKAAGARAGTRMNAAFVAGVARGLGIYHDEVDAPCERLRMGMPISVRTDADQPGTGNHIAPIRLEVPLDADEPDHLIAIAQALIDAQRHEPSRSVIEPVQQLMTRLPAPISGLAFAQVLRGSDCLTSNLPGSPVPMYVGSAQVLAQHPFGPTSAAAVNVTLLSYLGQAHIGISIDEAAAAEPAHVADCIKRGIGSIVAG